MRYIVFESFPLQTASFLHSEDGLTCVFDTFRAAKAAGVERCQAPVVLMEVTSQETKKFCNPYFKEVTCEDCVSLLEQEGVNYCSTCGNRLK